MQDFVEHVGSLNFIISAVGGIMVFSKQSERRLGICYLFIASLLWYELHTIKMHSFQMFSLMSVKNKYILIHTRMYLCNNQNVEYFYHPKRLFLCASLYSIPTTDHRQP